MMTATTTSPRLRERERGLSQRVRRASATYGVALGYAIVLSAGVGFVGLSGCGYGFAQSDRPFGAHRIAVVPFVEDEAIGVAPDLAQELSTRLAAGGVELVPSVAGADAVLTGEVITAATTPSPVAGAAASPSYTLRLVVKAALQAGEQVLWRTTLSLQDDYLQETRGGRGQVLATEANRREALRRAAVDAARQIHDQLTLAGVGR